MNKLFGIMLLMMATTMVFAGQKDVKFKVYGSCDMCETRIEKAANEVEGVTNAMWDKETMMLTVTLEDNTDEMLVHKAVAKVGHDTKKVKAGKDVYDALPGCCKYDRPSHSHDGCNTPCGAKKKRCCGGH